MAGVRTDQKFVDAVLDGWAEGVSVGRLAWRLNATRGLVTGIIVRARKAGDLRAATRRQEPDYSEALLDAWAEGRSERVLMERFGCTRDALRRIVARASEAGDPRAGSLRKMALADPRRQRDLEKERELSESRREVDATERVNAEILAALAAEPRPAGVPWGFGGVAPRGSMIGVRNAQPRQVVDVTAAVFGDPPAGRSALDMRGRG